MFRRTASFAGSNFTTRFSILATALGGGSLAYYYTAPTVHASEEKKPSSTLPSVYLWGDNSKGLISDGLLASKSVRVPTRVTFLDGNKLRSLAACPSFGLAALRNGDVVQWTGPEKGDIVLKSKKISKLHISPQSQIALALSEDGSLWCWQPAPTDPPSSGSGSGSGPGATSTPKKINVKLGWFEKIVSVDCGVDHVLALTNKGRVFSGALQSRSEHHGQLGIASFPHFEPLPDQGQLHHVKLLEAPVAQIACGAYHSLFLTRNGDLFGCGSNQFGQLMLPYTFRNTKISVPTRLPTLAQCPLGVSAVGAGSALTYFKSAGTNTKLTTSNPVGTTSSVNANGPGGSWFVAGDGEYGQFGTGSYAQCQVSPIRLAPLDAMREYNEKLGRVVPISIASNGWSIGQTHVFARVDNAAGDWLVWGSNERGQIGNNKLSKVTKPTPVPSAVVNHASLGATTFVAGDKITGCYQAYD